MVRTLLPDLIRAGTGIISGLARGIDTEAHETTLRENGATIAILGAGLDIAYPRENRLLLDRIGESGLLLSEFPFSTPPERMNFPKRNRIISGLSRAVLVVEAGLKSGALITADYAMEQGIDVFAIPGNLTSDKSVGPNRLIRDGAHPCLAPADLLSALGRLVLPKSKPAAKPETDPPEIHRLLNLLEHTPLHVDELIRQTGTSPAELHPLLLELEMNGRITRQAGMRYTLALS